MGNRVILVDDHKLVDDGIRAIIEHAGEFKVIAEAANGAERLRVTKKRCFRLGDHGYPATRAERCRADQRNGSARRKCQDSDPLLMRTKIPCSAFCDPVRGFVLKRASRGDLMDALRAVARGGSYCSSLISDYIIAQIRRGGSEAGERQPVGSKLTARELEILRLIMTGKSSKEIAVT